MPWQSRFKTQAAQQRALAIVMCFAFAFMLGSAFLYAGSSGWHRFELHHAKIYIQPDWQIKEQSDFRILLEKKWGNIEIRHQKTLAPMHKDVYMRSTWLPTKDMRANVPRLAIQGMEQNFGKHRKAYSFKYDDREHLILVISTAGMAQEFITLHYAIDPSRLEETDQGIAEEILYTFSSVLYNPPSP